MVSLKDDAQKSQNRKLQIVCPREK